MIEEIPWDRTLMSASDTSAPMEKNMLEAARDNGGFSTSQSSLPLANTENIPSKGKSKGVFATFDNSDPVSDGDQATGAHTAAGHSEWIKPGSTHKFPCLLQNMITR